MFVVALEVNETGTDNFFVRFLESGALTDWKFRSDLSFGQAFYTASPTIKYIDHQYYLWFLRREWNNPNCVSCETFITKLTRSKDLSTWETSYIPFLVPDRPDEGVNTSDVDLVELAGKTYIFYSAGDQLTWAHLKYATSDLPLSTLVRRYFPAQAR